MFGVNRTRWGGRLHVYHRHLHNFVGCRCGEAKGKNEFCLSSSYRTIARYITFFLWFYSNILSWSYSIRNKWWRVPYVFWSNVFYAVRSESFLWSKNCPLRANDNRQTLKLFVPINQFFFTLNIVLNDSRKTKKNAYKNQNLPTIYILRLTWDQPLSFFIFRFGIRCNIFWPETFFCSQNSNICLRTF